MRYDDEERNNDETQQDVAVLPAAKRDHVRQWKADQNRQHRRHSRVTETAHELRPEVGQRNAVVVPLPRERREEIETALLARQRHDHHRPQGCEEEQAEPQDAGLQEAIGRQCTTRLETAEEGDADDADDRGQHDRDNDGRTRSPDPAGAECYRTNGESQHHAEADVLGSRCDLCESGRRVHEIALLPVRRR